MEEIWKDIEGWEGFYQVSSSGRVKSLTRNVGRNDNKLNYIKERILKAKLCGQGYRCVCLARNASVKYITIHRLVAKAFIPNPEGKTDVNHIDGDKTNNAVSNLEWVTKRENSIHAYNTVLNIPPDPLKGSDHPGSKPVIQILNGVIVGEFESIRQAAKMTGVRKSAISRVCAGEFHRTGGFEWRFKLESG